MGNGKKSLLRGIRKRLMYHDLREMVFLLRVLYQVSPVVDYEKSLIFLQSCILILVNTLCTLGTVNKRNKSVSTRIKSKKVLRVSSPVARGAAMDFPAFSLGSPRKTKGDL